MNDTQHESDIEPESTDVEDTDELEPVSTTEPLPDETWQFKVPRIRRREVTYDDAGNKVLVLRTVRSRKVGRRRKKQYMVETACIELVASSLVDSDLAVRLEFEPVYGETHIHVLARRSWWEHGPAQLGIVLLALLMTAVTTFALVTTELNKPLVLLVWLLLMFGHGVAYFIVWMRWAYQYFVITNKRLGLIYSPPFSLPGTHPMSPIENITVNEANDQSWFANLLGRINPAYSYGMLNFDTPAQEDLWMREIKFIREHKRINELVSSLFSRAIHPTESDEQRSSRELQDSLFQRAHQWLDRQERV